MLTRLTNDHDHMRRTLNLLEVQFLDLCRGKTPDYTTMNSIVVYLHEYAEQSHHPFEDTIYSKLIQRAGNTKVIQTLITEHTELEVLTRHILQELDGLKKNHTPSIEFKYRLSRFLSQQRSHIYIEESEILPNIQNILSKNDLKQIALLTPTGNDPAFSQQTYIDYDRLRNEIK